MVAANDRIFSFIPSHTAADAAKFGIMSVTSPLFEKLQDNMSTLKAACLRLIFAPCPLILPFILKASDILFQEFFQPAPIPRMTDPELFIPLLFDAG